jgi:hypothetical protein
MAQFFAVLSVPAAVQVTAGNGGTLQGQRNTPTGMHGSAAEKQIRNFPVGVGMAEESSQPRIAVAAV